MVPANFDASVGHVRTDLGDFTWNPEAAPIKAVLEACKRWAFSSQIQTLVEYSGGTVDRQDSLQNRLDFLTDFSSRFWDFRTNGLRERWEVSGEPGPPRIVSALTELGVGRERTPSQFKFDVVAVPGATVKTCQHRIASATVLFEEGFRATKLVILSAGRPLAPFEVADAASIGIKATSEVDFLRELVEIERQRIEKYGCSIELVEFDPNVLQPRGCSITDNRRASTADTLAYWRAITASAPNYEYLSHKDRGTDVASPYSAKILLVTDPIYAPYQVLEFVRELSTECASAVDLACRARAGEPAYCLQHYLQEVRSVVLAISRLVTKLDER